MKLIHLFNCTHPSIRNLAGCLAMALISTQAWGEAANIPEPEWADIMNKKHADDFTGKDADALAFRYNNCSRSARKTQREAQVIAAYRRDFKLADSEFDEYIRNNIGILGKGDEDAIEDYSPIDLFTYRLSEKVYKMAYQLAPQYQSAPSNKPEYDAGNAYWQWCMSHVSTADVNKMLHEHWTGMQQVEKN